MVSETVNLVLEVAHRLALLLELKELEKLGLVLELAD